MLKVIGLAITLLFLKIVPVCQPYYFRHYQVEDGLPNNTVGSVLQDHLGFIWLGTKDGLSRFDGYSFKTFHNEKDNATSIGSDFIICLYEDKTGQLWVGTDRGLYRYNSDRENFSLEQNVPIDGIRSILLDNSGRLWVCVRNQLGWLDSQRKKFTIYENLKGHPVASISLSADSMVWVASEDGFIHKINPNTYQMRSYNVFGGTVHNTSKLIQKIYDTGKGIVFVGTASHGLYILNTRSGALTKKNMPGVSHTQVFIRDFAQYAQNEYWIASEAGIFIYNLETDHLIRLKKNYEDPYSLSDNAVYSLWRDKEGGMWVGTYFGGANYYPKQYTPFRKYFPQSDNNTIYGNAVHSICKDGYGNLWIGTEDAGLNRLEMGTGVATHFWPYDQTHKISHTNIHGLLINEEQIWVGTFHGGIDVLDVKTGKLLKHYSASKNSLSSDFVCNLIKTRSQKIILATDKGLCYFNPVNEKFIDITEVPRLFYKCIYEDSQGNIWAGSYSDGLFCYNPQSGRKQKFQYNPDQSGSLNSNRINWIFEDAEKQVWVGTEGGLSKFDPKANSFLNFTTKDGLPSNLVYAILEDDKGFFWISTSRGLFKYAPAENKVLAIYSRSNGLLTDQFNYNSAFKDEQGRLYFGSVKGMISFVPDSFQTNQYVPPIYFTGFQINNKEVAVGPGRAPLSRSIIHSSEITLDYDQSTFSIDFAALSFTTPEATEYAYIMKGLDQHWTYLKTNRKVFFTDLAPGTYTFTVRSAVNNGAWSNGYTMLKINILPPFWKSLWAYILYACALVTGGYFAGRSYHRYHLGKNKRKLEIIEFKKQKEINQAKIDFFTNIAHEIKTPLTLIKGPMEKIMDNTDNVQSLKENIQLMEKNTNRLIELTDQLLDFRKIEAGATNLHIEETDIVALLNDQYLRFLPVSEQKGLDFDLIHPRHFTAFVDIEAMNKIISNLIHNAIKYAHKTVLIELLPVTAGAKEFTIFFKNDGYIIPHEMKDKIFESFYRLKETDRLSGSGIGLSLSRSLAQLHNGNIVLQKSGEEALNIFALTLPVNNNIITTQ